MRRWWRRWVWCRHLPVFLKKSYDPLFGMTLTEYACFKCSRRWVE